MTDRFSVGNDECGVVTGVDAHEMTLIERCLPALTVLEGHGVNELSLLVRQIAGDGPDSWIARPRFYDGIHVPKKDRDSVINAYAALTTKIEDAIEDAIEGTDEEDLSFLASVHLRRRDAGSGWSINCEITAMISEDWPGTMIELK